MLLFCTYGTIKTTGDLQGDHVAQPNYCAIAARLFWELRTSIKKVRGGETPNLCPRPRTLLYDSNADS
jgi:hypothetical protein